MLEQIHNSLIIKVLGREQAQAITSIRSLVKKPDLSKDDSATSTVPDEAVNKLDKFIQDSRVQHAVEKDYNSCNYEQFDPNTGDNGCESRIFLYAILSKRFTVKYKYAELSPHEKLILSICHIATRCMKDSKDKFGILTGSKTVDIIYADPNPSKSNAVNIKKFNQKGSYSARELLEYATSYFSTQFILLASKELSLSFASDLISYNRSRLLNKQTHLLPPQCKNGPASAFYFEYIAACKLPFVIKITHLKISNSVMNYSSTAFYTYDYISSSIPKIVILSDELKQKLISSEEPVAIYEGVTVLQAEQTKKCSELQDRIIDNLKTYIIGQAIRYDITHGHSLDALGSSSLKEHCKSFEDIPYNSKAYSEISKDIIRNTDISGKSIPLNMIHAYIGNMKREIESVNSKAI